MHFPALYAAILILNTLHQIATTEALKARYKYQIYVHVGTGIASRLNTGPMHGLNFYRIVVVHFNTVDYSYVRGTLNLSVLTTEYNCMRHTFVHVVFESLNLSLPALR